MHSGDAHAVGVSIPLGTARVTAKGCAHIPVDALTS